MGVQTGPGLFLFAYSNVALQHNWLITAIVKNNNLYKMNTNLECRASATGYN